MTQFSDTCLQLKQLMKKLTFSSASAPVKIDVLTKSVYFSNSNYPLKQYIILDSMLYPLLLNITNSTQVFPYDLLHLLGILLRSLHAPSDSPHHIAITFMLARQASLQLTFLANNQALILNTTNLPPNWLLSLLRWLGSHGLQITRQDTLSPHLSTDASLIQIALLHKWNIQYLQDILPSTVSLSLMEYVRDVYVTSVGVGCKKR